jgi:hypothetical protein
MLPDDIQTVFVPTVVNRTTEPLVDVEVTQAIIQEIQLDGSLRIASADEADSVLDVVVYDFDMAPLAFSRGDQRTLADEFRVTLRASFVLKRRLTEEVIAESPLVTGDTSFVVTGDLSSGKRRALPNAAADLGRKMVDRVVEVW